MAIKKKVLGNERIDHFVPLYVGRNARRKMTSDILVSFKQFLEWMQSTHGHKKSTFVFHCDPLDAEGANLHHVLQTLDLQQNVVFSKDRVGFADMNSLYNMCDVAVNRSCAEGFGLPTLEMMMTGKPIIALKTGGMTRQVEDAETGEHYGIPLDVEIKCLVGNQQVPFIWEDLCSHDQLTKALIQMYEWGPEKRAEVGIRAMQHAHKDYDLDKMVRQWDVSLTDLVNDWKSGKRPTRWQRIDI
jgi:glycosyltransferase involved in cell wall biosynthesis